MTLDAIDEKNFPKVRYLVENLGVDPNGFDAVRNTPMLWAASDRTLNIFSYLVDHGGDINIIHPRFGRLFRKVNKEKQMRVMEYLLLKGVDIPNATLNHPNFQEWKNGVLGQLERQAEGSRNPILIKKHNRLKSQYDLPVEEPILVAE